MIEPLDPAASLGAPIAPTAASIATARDYFDVAGMEQADQDREKQRQDALAGIHELA